MSGGSGWLWATTRENASKINTVSSSLDAVSSSLDAVSSSLDAVSSSLSSPSGGSGDFHLLSASYISASHGTVMNTTSETVFVNYSIPSGTLDSGVLFNFKSRIYVAVGNGANFTGRVRLSGSSGDILSVLDGLGVAAGDVFDINVDLMGVTSPASGSEVIPGNTNTSPNGTVYINSLPTLILRYPTDENIDLTITGQWDAADGSAAFMPYYIATKVSSSS